MRLKISVTALFLLAACLIPRHSFADTVTLTLESSDGSIYPYGFDISGESGIVDMSCLNNGRTVNIGESWTATAVNLESLISTPGNNVNTSIGGIKLGQLEEDAILDADYLTNPSSPNYTLNNIEVQDAIWSILDDKDVYSDLDTNAEKIAVQKLITTAVNTYSTETSSFYSDFTFYYPQTWGTRDDDDQSGGEPQQFLGYCPPAITPEPSGLILLGTGMLGLAGAMRRRMNRG